MGEYLYLVESVQYMGEYCEACFCGKLSRMLTEEKVYKEG